MQDSSKLVEVEKYLETQIQERNGPQRYWSLASAYFAIGLCRMYQGHLDSAIDFMNTAIDYNYHDRETVEVHIRECWEKLPRKTRCEYFSVIN